MDDTINEKTINKRFNAKESNYKTSAPIIGNSLESRIFASRRDVDKIKDLLTKNNADLSILNDEYIKYFNELYIKYNSINEELKDIIEDFNSNIEYKKFSIEDSPFIFDKEFFEKWDLSEDKTKFTLTNLTQDFLNKEIEFVFKVKNVGFYCRKNIMDYITNKNINYTIKYYINDEEVTSFVKEYKKENYEEDIKFKVIFLISSISSEYNYINIDYNFFKQFATTNNDSKFYLNFNKLTNIFDINIPEEDQNVISYSDENKEITFKTGYENKTSEGIEDIIEEKDENININGNQIYSSYNANSSIVEKTMNLQSNIDNEKIIGIEKHPTDESKEVNDGIEIKGNENGEDIVLTVKDRVVDSHLYFYNKPNYVYKVDDQDIIVKNENIESEEFKMIELNTPRINKLSFKYSKQYQNSEENTTGEESNNNEKIIIFSDNEKIFEEIIDKDEGNIEYEFDTIKNRNIKIYVSNKENNIDINISNIKYSSINTIEIEYENADAMSIEDLNNISILNLIDEIMNKYNITNSEREELNTIRKYINNKEDLLNLQFPVERPVTSEQIYQDSYVFYTVRDFIYGTAYWNLLTSDEQKLMEVISDDYSSVSLTDEEKSEILADIYNKYEISEDKEGEYKEYLINLYKKYAGNKNMNLKYKSDDNILESMSVNELLNKITAASDKPFEQNEKEVIYNISDFMNNKNSLMNLQFPVERPIENKIIHGGRVYVFK